MSTSRAAEEALEELEERGERVSAAGRSARGVSDAVREEVQRSLDGAGAIGMGEEEVEEGEEVDDIVVESVEKEERRRLRARAFAIVVYASGDRYGEGGSTF